MMTNYTPKVKRVRGEGVPVGTLSREEFLRRVKDNKKHKVKVVEEKANPLGTCGFDNLPTATANTGYKSCIRVFKKASPKVIEGSPVRPCGPGISEEGPEPSKKLKEIQLSWWALLWRPWSWKWKWVFALGGVLSALLGFITQEESDVGIVFASVMSMWLPLTILTFLYEVQPKPRSNFFVLLVIAFVGGGVSALCAGFLNVMFLTHIAFAGVTEEPIKALMLLPFLFIPGIYARRFDGILLGAAVGAGFSIFENVEYAYLLGESPSFTILLIRNIGAPFMHVAWTATVGGVMWSMRQRDGIFGLVHPKVWGVFCGVIVLHMIWNVVPFLFVIAMLPWLLLFHYIKVDLQASYDLKGV